MPTAVEMPNLRAFEIAAGEPGGPFITANLLNFAIGSSLLRKEHRDWLADVAAPFLSKSATATCELFGRASRSGSAAFNQQLSRRRVESVMNALADVGVDLAKVNRAEGFGEQWAAESGIADGTESGEERAVSVILMDNGPAATGGVKRISFKLSRAK